ncbi:hypothetical protein FRC08_013669 [Ceratobasidium sp. 394]|nr:hypothetical protein FRC08_013669 [Ceratobasidium sp. 394]
MGRVVRPSLDRRYPQEGKPSKDTKEEDCSSTLEPWMDCQVQKVQEQAGQDHWADYREQQREATREGGWNVDGKVEDWAEEAEQAIEEGWPEPKLDPEAKLEQEPFWGQGERYDQQGQDPPTPISAYLWEQWNAQVDALPYPHNWGSSAKEEISWPSWSKNLLFSIRRMAGGFVEGLVDVFVNGSN